MAPDPENFRGIHAVRLLSQNKKWSLESLLDLAYDPLLPAFEVLIPPLVRALKQAKPESSLSAVRQTLETWDYRVSESSVAMTIAHFYGLQVLKDGVTVNWIDEKSALETFASTASSGRQIELLNVALADLTKRFGSWNLPWGDVNRLQRLTGEMAEPHSDEAPSLPVGMASGRWGALASFGSKRFAGTDKLYGYSGNSFVAVVEFGDRLRARTMLAGGQSGDPRSPHFFDQSQRYVDRTFKDIAFYREDVEARATARYQPGR